MIAPMPGRDRIKQWPGIVVRIHGHRRFVSILVRDREGLKSQSISRIKAAELIQALREAHGRGT